MVVHMWSPIDQVHFDLYESLHLRAESAVVGGVLRFVANSATAGGEHFI